MVTYVYYLDKIGFDNRRLNMDNNNVRPNSKPVIDKQVVRTDNKLDNAISNYYENLEKLKIEDFIMRKKVQDELLNKINHKMERIKNGLNDKTYFKEDIYKDWYKELKFNFNKY